MESFFHLHAETPPLEDGPEPDSIDALNDETFGDGAIEGDWENAHAQFAADHFRGHDLSSVNSLLNDDELEISNQQLAAAVEELVLKSDQDQDAIDPAIVSLRKESRPSGFRNQSELLSPYLESEMSNSSTGSDQLYFLSDGMKSIWGKSSPEPGNIGDGNLYLLNQLNSENKESSSPIEDPSILTAVKSNFPPVWNPSSLHSSNPLSVLLGSHVRRVHTGVVRAEDLEKEFTLATEPRSPSPTYGVSIPKVSNHDSQDRSLPARSVSPIIGSPPSHEFPIGTPPKQRFDMEKQRHMHTPQNLRMPRGFPLRQPYPIPPGMMMPRMAMPSQPWPPHPSPRNFSQRPDMLNRFGLSRNLGLAKNNASPGASPVGSPHFGSGPIPIRPGMPHQFFHPVPNKFSRTPPMPHGFGPEPRFMPPLMVGPGHLHPEHRRFVYMQQQQRSQRQFHNNRNHPHNYNRNHNRDPYANLMTQREKDWVIKIQMMALQSDRPEIDDYYYQNYIEIQLEQGGLELNDDNLKNKRLLTPTKANPDNRKYIPVQFKDSLGKLTVSSVYSPRQVIDVVHKATEDEANEGDNKQALSKRFEIYKTIEKAYEYVMFIEENISAIKNPNIPPEKKPAISQGIKESKIALIELFKFDSEECSDIISMMLRVRKGKRLLSRVLSLVSKEYGMVIIMIFCKGITTFIKRDVHDNVLPEMYHPICEVLALLNSDNLFQIATILTPNLSVICANTFGLSLTCKTLCLGHQHTDLQNEACDNGKSWRNFVKCSTSAMLELFGGPDKVSEVHLIDSDIATKIIEIFKQNEERIFIEGQKNKEIVQEKLKNTTLYFSSFSEEKT